MIGSKIFNTEKTDYETPVLLMGTQDAGLFDTVNKSYPEIWELYKTMKSLDWDENEFDYSSCNQTFKTCPEHISDKMIKTLAWQWESDSVAARTIYAVLAPFITAPELSAAWQRISDNECLIEGTEVLTPKGWVDLSEVQVGDSVCQYEMGGTTSFQSVSHVVEKDYNGDLYAFKNPRGHINQVVTPKHRMIRRSASNGEYEVGEAGVFDFKKGAADRRWSSVSSGVISGSKTKLSAEEAFLIAVQADGSISSRYDGSICDTIPVWFSFAKERKVDRLQRLVAECGFALTELSGRSASENSKSQRRFKVDVPLKYSAYLKNFNWVDLHNVDSSWCTEFLDEIIAWDGNFTKNTGILHTTSRQAVDICQAAASLSGFKTHLSQREDSRSDKFSDCYRLSWKKQGGVSGQGIVKSVTHYKGKVRCLTIPSGFFLVRYKGAVSVTGNCVHAATYSEIVRMSFDNPREVLDTVLEVTESVQRLEIVAEVLQEAYTASHEYALGLIENDQETYNKVFMMIVALLALEGIQFMSSFAITFSICDTGLFQPIGKAVQKIAQDEYEVHVELDKAVLKRELATERGKIAFQQCEHKIQKLLDEVIASEFEWLDYLFSDGEELVGVNADLCKRWTLYCAKPVYNFFGLKYELPFPKKNPLKFMDSWLDISKTQAAPQEQDNAQYKVGVTRRNDEGKTFDTDF